MQFGSNDYAAHKYGTYSFKPHYLLNTRSKIIKPHTESRFNRTTYISSSSNSSNSNYSTANGFGTSLRSTASIAKRPSYFSGTSSSLPSLSYRRSSGSLSSSSPHTSSSSSLPSLSTNNNCYRSSSLSTYNSRSSLPKSPTSMSSLYNIKEEATSNGTMVNGLSRRDESPHLYRNSTTAVERGVSSSSSGSMVGKIGNSSGSGVTSRNSRDRPLGIRASGNSSSVVDEVAEGISKLSTRGGGGGDSSPPSSASKPKKDHTNGLRNLGSTCYINSIVQCLGHTVSLNPHIFGNDSIDVDKLPKDSSSVLNAYQQLVAYLWSTEEDADFSTVKGAVQKLRPSHFDYGQQDAHEFLRHLIDRLHTSLKGIWNSSIYSLDCDRTPTMEDAKSAASFWSQYRRCENSYLLDLFAGLLKSTLTCTHCNQKSVTFEVFWDVSLPLPSPNLSSGLTLRQLLQNFTQEEELEKEEWPKCDNCKVRRRMIKNYSFQKLPKYLIFNLKRFYKGNTVKKITTHVDFPMLNLDMRSYLASSATTNCSTYNLYAVTNHAGYTGGGHYTAYCKSPYNKQWCSYDDSSVRKLQSMEIVTQCAYILFYEATH